MRIGMLNHLQNLEHPSPFCTSALSSKFLSPKNMICRLAISVNKNWSIIFTHLPKLSINKLVALRPRPMIPTFRSYSHCHSSPSYYLFDLHRPAILNDSPLELRRTLQPLTAKVTMICRSQVLSHSDAEAMSLIHHDDPTKRCR